MTPVGYGCAQKMLHALGYHDLKEDSKAEIPIYRMKKGNSRRFGVKW